MNRKIIEDELKAHPKRYYTIQDLMKLCGIKENSIKGMMNRIIFWDDNFHKGWITIEKDNTNINGVKRKLVTEKRVYFYEEK